MNLEQRFKAEGIRASADLANERMNAKIRNAQLLKTPYMLVVGDQEVANDTVALRKRDGSRQDAVPVAEFLAGIKARIQSRAADL